MTEMTLAATEWKNEQPADDQSTGKTKILMILLILLKS
jgi:hypothetical protein